MARVPSTTCQQYSTKVIDTDPAAPEEEVVEEPPGIFRRFWRWLNSDDGELEVRSLSVTRLTTVVCPSRYSLADVYT